MNRIEDTPPIGDWRRENADKETRSAMDQIDKLVAQATEALRNAEELAIKHNVAFSFHPAYGMGGYFYPEGGKYHEAGWKASSHSC